MPLDLTDEETAAFVKELRDIVENPKFPLSPRIRTLGRSSTSFDLSRPARRFHRLGIMNRRAWDDSTVRNR